MALVEKERSGDVCPNRGCIPTKALIHSAEVYRLALQAAMLGIDLPGGAERNCARMVARKQEVVDRLVGGVNHLLQNHNGALFPA